MDQMGVTPETFGSSFFLCCSILLFLGGVLGAGTGPVAVIILCRVSTRGCDPSPCFR